MTRLQRLELRKAALVTEMRAISDTAEKDGQRSLTEDETRSAKNSETELETVEADIARETRLQDLEKSCKRSVDPNTAAQDGDQPPKKPVRIERVSRHGKLKAFTGEDADQRAYESGKFLQATVGGSSEARQWCLDNGIEFRTMVTNDDSKGGIFVPAPMETAIIDLREEYGVARQECDIVPMSSDTLTIPRRASGVTAYFVGEGSEITASDAAFDVVSLTARKLAAMTKITSELAEDSLISMADRIAMEMAYAFAVKEDGCLFNGDGTSTYGGIKGLKNALLAGSQYTAIAGNTAFSTLDLEDFEAMIAKLPSFPGIQPKWYIHKAGWAQSMLRLGMATGGLTPADLAAGAGMQFMGYPVKFVNTMNSTLAAQTSTTGLIYFGDMRMTVALGSRRGVTIAADSSRYFEFDLTAVRATERVDINCHENGTASAAGPMIVLVTPGA